MPAPIIHLKRNFKYTFNQYLTDHTLIIATDSLGGPGQLFTKELNHGLKHYYRTEDGVDYDGPVYFDTTKKCFYTGTSASIESSKVHRYKTEFTPVASTPSTLYYTCVNHESEGGQINIINDTGAIMNTQEEFYLLGIQQTNRTYNIKHSNEIAENFLANTVPAGLSPKLFNFAPQVEINPVSDRWYDPANGDNEILLSGLIIDPENDILTYEWSQVFPEEATLTGLELKGEFSNPNGPVSNFIIQSGETPPVDTAYTFKLTVKDSDNTSFDTVDVKVSGLDTFDLFSDSGFAFSDVNLDFDILDETDGVD